MAVIISGLDQAGEPYSVACALTGPEADMRDVPEWGDVRGTGSVIAALRAYEGDDVPLTPTGPFVPLRPNDHHSVIAWLGHYTQILDSEGDPGIDSRLGVQVPDADY